MFMKKPSAEPGPRPRRVRYLPLVAFLVAVLCGLAVSSAPGSTVSDASGCSAGYHQTFSKYAGTYCMKNTGPISKATASVVGGCVVGLFGGTLLSLLGGCGAGAVGAITGSV